MLRESVLLDDPQRVVWFNKQPLCIYGDPPYPVLLRLQARYRPGNVTRDQINYKDMSEAWVAVEWVNKASEYFEMGPVTLKEYFQ